MKLKNRLSWQEVTGDESLMTGYQRTVCRFAENLADLTEKNMEDGLDFYKSMQFIRLKQQKQTT